MKKIISTLFFLIIFSFMLLVIILSTKGIETKKFNNFISKKINQANKNIGLELTSVYFKLDIKEVGLYLETINSQIDFQGTIIPSKNIRVYIDFVSLIKSKPKIKKINLVLNQLDINELKKISQNLKPSNFTSFLKYKIKQGTLSTKLDIFLDKKNSLSNFIAKGSVSNLKAEIVDNIELKKTNFNFFADKTDILIKNIFSESGPIKILDGDIRLNLSSEISLDSNFKTNIKYKSKFKNYNNLIKDVNFVKNLVDLEAEINNNFSINFDETYKVKKYNYKSNGLIKRANLNFKSPLKTYFLEEKINEFSIINSEIKINLGPKKNITNILGKYSLNKGNNLLFNLEHIIERELLKIKINADYDKPIVLDFINYQKAKGFLANFSIDLEKKKNNIKIKKFNLIEGDNSFSIKDLKLNKNKFLSLKELSVKTVKDKQKNNDFSIAFGKKILIKGKQFDAINLPKILNQKTSNNFLSHINKEVEIDLINIKAPLSENLNNFKLIGKIQKGKFIKISAKGDFGENNFLDISMKHDQLNNKKYLEIYSDLTRPLLTEYNFFKGLTGGKLLFSSIIDQNRSSSNLKIENFNLINAPGMVKLLSLADLGGLADLAEGQGLSFDILEIQMDKDKDYLKINEILALGPSISVLMEGYQNPKLTSLRGTLVPAKTLNKMISKIPLIGDIIIPKEAGEGLFGISFKIKGPPGKLKTSINPIRTLTPRFIQKIVDKSKNSK